MPGLSFDNYFRNQYLSEHGVAVPTATSTGTTIVGCRFDGGVVIAADTRATAGNIVADKNTEKLHRIAPNVWCAGAGTAADNDQVTKLEASNIELHALSTNREPRVVAVLTHLKQYLFKYQGHVGAYLIVAGLDCTGPQLYSIHAHGSTDVGYYLSLGSGSLAAMAVLEANWKKDLTKQEAMDLCGDAIEAGIWNDLGSGSNVDICVMEKGQPSKLYRNVRKPNERAARTQSYKMKRGTTAVLDKRVTDLVDVIDVDISREQSMDIDS